MSASTSVTRSRTPSERLLKSLALFGLTLDDAQLGNAQHQRRLLSAHAAARDVLPRLVPGALVMVTGPSGSGKSTLLKILTSHARRASWRVCHADEQDAHAAACVAEVFAGPLTGEAGALRALAAAGLADATLLARSPSALSGGQRFRLALAQAFLRCGKRGDHRPTLLLADEFAVTLDRVSAKSLSIALRRWASKSVARAGSSGVGEAEKVGRVGAAVVVATPHDDLLEHLRPDLLVVVNDAGEFEVVF